MDPLSLLAAIGDVDPNTPGTQPGWMLQAFVQYALPAIGSLLLGVSAWAAAKLGQWAHAKSGSEKLGQGIERATETAGAAIAAALSDIGPRLTAAAADGVVTRGEMAAIAADAAGRVGKTLGAKGLELLRQNLGIADVAEYMRGKVILEANALGVKRATEIHTVDDAAAELRKPVGP